MSSRKLNILFFIGAAVILIAPLILRLTKGFPLLAGQDAYLELRIAQDIFNGNFYFQDTLSSNIVHITPYHFIIAGMMYLFGTNAALVCNIIFGALSALALKFLLKKLDLEEDVQNIVLVLFLASPLYLGLATVHGGTAFSLSMMLGCIVFLFYDKLYLSAIAAGLCALSGLDHAIVVIVTMLMLMIFKKAKGKAFVNIFIAAFMIIALHIPWLITTAGLESVKLEAFRLTALIADFGSLGSFSIFTAIMSWVGTWLWWISSPNIRKTAIVFSLEFASWKLGMQPYALIGGCIFAGILFVRVSKLKWPDKRIHQAMVLFIALGVLFSAISFSTRISNAMPDDIIAEDMIKLKELTSPDAVIFSDPSHGYWIQEMAGRRVLLDPSLRGVNANHIYNESLNIMESYNIQTTKSFFRENNVTNIYISEQMYDSYWGEDRGLKFLLQNSENFKTLYQGTKRGIWRIES